MSTLFTISGGNLTTNNIFARTIAAADTTGESNPVAIGTFLTDVTTFASDGSTIWGVSFNVKSRADNPTGYLSCKLYDILNVERGSCLVPISNFPPGDGSDNFESKVSQSWQTIKFDNAIPTTTGDKFYLRLSASTNGELYFYGGTGTNNSISSINSHMIVSQGQGLNTAVASFSTIDGSSIFTKTNVASSAALPTNSNTNTSSLSFNGVNSTMTVLTNILNMAGDYTIECWFNPFLVNYDSSTSTRHILQFGSRTNSTSGLWISVDNGSVNCTFGSRAANGASNPNIFSLTSDPNSVSINTWYHVALCKQGNSFYGFLNGTQLNGSPVTISNSNLDYFFTNFNKFYIGRADYFTDRGRFSGLIYNIRIICGRAIYTSNFTLPRPDSVNATVETSFFYNDARGNIYYADSLDKAVIGGYLSGTSVVTHTVSSNLDYYNLNNISIQNNGVFTTSPNTNTTFNIINNGLKIGSGGKFILSASPGFKKTISMEESKIQVFNGGSFEVYGQPKTKGVSLTGSYANNLSAFAFDTTPTNWAVNDSLIFLPTSAGVTQFEELCARTVTTNRLSTFTRSSFAHEKYSGIPSVVNATRNVAIKGSSSSRRGWLQFDKTSNTKICDVEFEHLGRDGAKTESLIFNVKQGGSFLLSGCYLDGSTSTSVKATTLFGKCYNLNIRDNVFYKYSDSALTLNNVADSFTIKNNIILNSGSHGVYLKNATIQGNIDISDNISLGNSKKGLLMENVDGDIYGWTNWMNVEEGASIGASNTGEFKDLANEDAVITETNANTFVFDNPFGDAYPDEISTYYTGTIQWEANTDYNFAVDFTFEGFFKFDYPAIGEGSLFVCDTTSNLGSFSLAYIPNSRTFKLYTNESTSTIKLTIVRSEYLIGWNHIALVRKDGVISVLLNGQNIGTYNTNFEFYGTTSGISIGINDINTKYVYGYRVLTRAEYDPALPTYTVPTAPFVVDSETVALYYRTLKTGKATIQNIKNYFNQGGGMSIDNTIPGLKSTIIKNISSISNTGVGFSLSGKNTDYRTPNTLTATDIYCTGNSTIGFNITNMVGLLTGVYVADSGTVNTQLTLGDGITKIKSLTSLAKDNSVENMTIKNSKSLRPVILDGIVLDKSTSLVGNYTAPALTLNNTEFLDFHFDNSTLNTVSTGFAVNLVGSVLGTYQFSNTTTTSAGVQNLSCLPPDNIKSGGIIFMNKNRNIGSHESFYRKGRRVTDTSIVAGNIAEKITPNSLTDRFKSGSKFVAVSTNDTVTLKMKVTTTINGEARLMLKKNSSLGFNEDVLLYPISNSSTLTTTSPSASGVGIMEFYVDCTGTTGSVIIDDWKAK